MIMWNSIVKNKGKVILFSVLSAVLIVLVSVGIWYSVQPKFQKLTLELGQDLPEASEFATNFSIKDLCRFETDIEEIDISKPGEYQISLKHGLEKETVTLVIEDTTAPLVEFCDVTVNLGTEVTAEDFVTEVFDLSKTNISFATQMTENTTFGVVPVDIVVSDIYGNSVQKNCNLHYIWIVPQFVLEIGDQITMDDLLTCEEREDMILSQEWIDMINQSPVGAYTFESHYGEHTQTCTVIVEDTKGPEIVTKDLTVYLGDTITAEDFIEFISDGSGAYTLTADNIPETNIQQTYTVNLEAVDPVGNKTVTTAQLTVIEDLEGPVFSGIGTLNVEIGSKANYISGVRATDNHDGSVSFDVDYSSVNAGVLGAYSVKYYAVDRAGNRTTVSRTVNIIPDKTPPKFSGLSDMTVEKHSNPDYLSGVLAIDSCDGEVSFTYDADSVDTAKAGTYYITYTSEDKAGNLSTARRKVVVKIDSADVAALVAQEASGLSSNPETIRDYVLNSIAYNSSWGDEYPVWYGFTNRKGNCYVHALCFQALLNAKGYETRIIWTSDKTHYWTMVKIGGEWKHMDATPGFPAHRVYSIMNDEQRHETLNGRDWDRTAWPESK